MSQPDSTDANRGVVVQKPKADIYTWLLLVALIAILLAVTFLALELKRYDWDFKAAGARAAAVHYVDRSATC